MLASTAVPRLGGTALTGGWKGSGGEVEGPINATPELATEYQRCREETLSPRVQAVQPSSVGGSGVSLTPRFYF